MGENAQQREGIFSIVLCFISTEVNGMFSTDFGATWSDSWCASDS